MNTEMLLWEVFFIRIKGRTDSEEKGLKIGDSQNL